MISKLNHSWRRRFAAGAALVITAALTFLVAAARPDAGNPILGTIKANIVASTATTVTIQVKGEWNWLSHDSDCNYDRAATGAGLAWGDRNGADSTRGVTSIVRSNGTVTITVPAFTATQAPNVGDRIMIAGLTGAGAALNTTTPVVLTSATTTTLKYAQAGANIAAGSYGGAGKVMDIDIFNGWEVYKSATSNGWIGTQFNNTVNPIDRSVHPVDRGNIPADGQGPLPGALVSNGAPVDQKRFDPGMNATTGLSNSYLAWKGGCGREPVFPQAAITAATDNASKVVTLTLAAPGNSFFNVGDSITVSGLTPTGYNGTWTITSKIGANQITYTSRTANMAPGTGANAKVTTNVQPSGAQQNGPGCLEWCGDPWGSWGYDTFDSGSYTQGFQHTYLKQIPDPLHPGQFISGLPEKICVNFYDVHGGGTTASAFQLVNSAKEVPVDANGDNSIQTNAFNINEGANCTSAIGSNLTTTAETPKQVGGSIHDTAHLKNVPNGAGGTITFKLYGPSVSPTCAAGAEIFTSTKPVSGTGSDLNIDSASFTPTAVGSYYWTADYSGDPNFNVAGSQTACGDDGETSVITPASPTLVTNAGPDLSLDNAPLTLNDSATISGAYAPISGSITFRLYGPGDATCTGAVKYTETVSVTANGSVSTATGFTLPNNGSTVTGTWRWTASFHSNDANNNDVAAVCNGPVDENVVVGPAHPAIVTHQNLIPNDSATVTNGPVTPTGQVTFRLYRDDATCSDSNALVFSQTKTLSGGTAKTTNTGGASPNYTATGNHTWYWRVNYAGDSSHDPSVSDCVERFTITE